ncbi:MAG: ABC transporter ATP-binding protein [Pseudonocardia sp.]|nr:ABC transporter ATP-binding protein [Pseudonocardia sp.]MBO0875494.1 ABC transporter ATP-binding protein [Pseudonocardia sp.]
MSAVDAPLLRVRNLTVRFGGLLAVNDVSFTADRGELLGIIGPNGAGKTTSFNAIAGAVRPTSGTIHIGESQVSGNPPERVARLGIARTFQSVRLFRTLSVAENVAVAASVTCRSMTAARERAAEVAGMLGIESRWHTEVGELPLADQKKVEIARALALSPRLLLLDEMMSGLTEAETRDIIELIKGLNAGGLTIIVIEHVLRVIMELSHRVVVLDHGALIAEGPPKEVMANPRVVEAYLGAHAARTVGDSG